MRRRLLVIAFVLAASVANAASAAAPTETIRLHARPGSTATGSATVGASGRGTLVLLDLHGLVPASGVRALLHAGTCAHFGASFAAIVTATANAKGAVRTRGHVLFHGYPWTTARLPTGARHHGREWVARGRLRRDPGNGLMTNDA